MGLSLNLQCRKPDRKAPQQFFAKLISWSFPGLLYAKTLQPKFGAAAIAEETRSSPGYLAWWPSLYTGEPILPFRARVPVKDWVR